MNTSNPFQIPACLQRTEYERRQKRFRQAVIAVVAGCGLLLVGLLIEGCKTERAAGAQSITPLGTVPMAVETPADAVSAGPTPAGTAPAGPRAAVPQTAPIVSKPNAAPARPPAVTAIYVVKPGDNLTRIARAHGISVKAIEAANGLMSDRIAAGAKLKMPAA